MALTLKAEQRLERVELIQFFDMSRGTWVGSAQRTYRFVRRDFPEGALIRRDDVANALIPILEVNEALRDRLNESKLRQKFWISDFADLIIDRVWDEIRGDDTDEK
jgi:hypothetical protein